MVWLPTTALVVTLRTCYGALQIVVLLLPDGETRMVWLPDGERCLKIYLFVLT